MIVVIANCSNYLFLSFRLMNVSYTIRKFLCTLIGIKFILIYFMIFKGKNGKDKIYYNNPSFGNEDLKYSCFWLWYDKKNWNDIIRYIISLYIYFEYLRAIFYISFCKYIFVFKFYIDNYSFTKNDINQNLTE